MSNESAKIEQHIEHLKEAVQLRDLVLKLEQNTTFKKLILEKFCVTECARYAQLSADPALKEGERADALALAQAAGHLRRFLAVSVRMGDRAEDDIKQAEEQLAEIRSDS